MVTQKSAAVQDKARLILLADGGALADLNERLESENSARKDFVRIPDAVIKMIGEDIPIECPIDCRVFCTVGSEKAQNFLKSIGQAWTVRPFPLSMARYERDSAAADGQRHPFRLRFHAYLGYALGLLSGSRTRKSGQTVNRPIKVGVISNDAHLLPCMSDLQASDAAVDVRLVWWENSLSDEVQYLAARNGVKLCLLPNDEEVSFLGQHHRDRALEGLLLG
jgi:hypothetical protein